MQSLNVKKNVIIFFSFILVITYYFRLNQLYDVSTHHATSWWLFNYESGFTRRGLIGQILLYFSDFFDLNILYILKVLQLFSFSFYIYLVTHYLSTRKISNTFLLLYFCPGLFLAYVYDIFYIGRQEMYLFIYFFFYISLCQKEKVSIIFTYLNPLIFILLILTHESLIFYFSYFLTAEIIFNKRDERDTIYLKFFVNFLFCLATILLIMHFHQFTDLNIICEKIVSIGGPVNTCNDMFVSSNNMSISETIKIALPNIQNANYFVNYFILACLCFISIFFFFKDLPSNTFKNNQIYFLFFFNFAGSIPLFILTYDWGRWIHMNLMLIFLICIRLLPPTGERVGSEQKFGKNFLFVLCIIIYSTTWSMPVCCQPEFKFGIFEKIPKLYNLIW